MKAETVAMLAPSDAANVDEYRIGGKAVGLARLHALAFDVPPFFVIPCEAFREHLAKGEVPAALGRAMLALQEPHHDDDLGRQTIEGSGQLRTAVEDEPLDASLCEQIVRALAELGSGPYAVRSSMVGEDSARHSFAGQLETQLYQREAEEVMGA